MKETKEATTFEIKGENAWFIAGDSERTRKKGLERGALYSIEMSMIGPYLEQKDFVTTLPPKVYGKTEEQVSKWLKAYYAQDKNLGVYLAGIKGSGKTIAGKMLILMSGLPVIILNRQIDEHIKSFIESIQDDCIVLMDEFEKYHVPHLKNGAPELLTLLDGAVRSHKLFIMISNEATSLPEFMRNRTSRVRYIHYYSYLTIEEIREVVSDKILNKERVGEVVSFCVSKGAFTMDTLCSFVEEINLFNEDLESIYFSLNVIPERGSYSIDAIGKGGAYNFITGTRAANFILGKGNIVVEDKCLEEEILIANKFLADYRNYQKECSKVIAEHTGLVNKIIAVCDENSAEYDDFISKNDSNDDFFRLLLEEVPEAENVLNDRFISRLTDEIVSSSVTSEQGREVLCLQLIGYLLPKAPETGPFKITEEPSTGDLSITICRVVNSVDYSNKVEVQNNRGLLYYKTDNPSVFVYISEPGAQNFRSFF